jgi:hypothetical protein
LPAPQSNSIPPSSKPVPLDLGRLVRVAQPPDYAAIKRASDERLAREAAEEARRKAEEAARIAEAARKAALARAPVATPAPVVRTVPAGAGEATAYAQSIAGARGWLWPNWHELGMRESAWEQGRINVSSLACGIPQALPCTKLYPHATPDWIRANMYQVCRNGSCKWYIPGDWRREVDWMTNYIAGRYVTPSAALAYHNRMNWY